MPLYSFANSRGQICDLFFTMREAPKIGQTITDNGVAWTRVFTVPNARIAVTIDPYSKTDFLKKTMGKTETFGDMFDRSAELSAKRADKEGVDHVKERYFDNYEKRTKGIVHSERQKQKARKLAADTNASKAMREMGITVKVNA